MKSLFALLLLFGTLNAVAQTEEPYEYPVRKKATKRQLKKASPMRKKYTEETYLAKPSHNRRPAKGARVKTTYTAAQRKKGRVGKRSGKVASNMQTHKPITNHYTRKAGYPSRAKKSSTAANPRKTPGRSRSYDGSTD